MIDVAHDMPVNPTSQHQRQDQVTIKKPRARGSRKHQALEIAARLLIRSPKKHKRVWNSFLRMFGFGVGVGF